MIRHVTRSERYFGKIDQFLKAEDESRLFLQLYSNEIVRVEQKYPELIFTKVSRVKASANDKRYEVLVEKKSNN